ncbi:MAG: hypothetical protein QXO20_05145 [Candidatus Bathyarchaeia archaeon]
MIFISKNGEKCESVEFKDEEEFRVMLLRLIEEDRNLLLPVSLEGKRPSILLLTKEFGVSSGSIDLLGIDSEGFIYIIETKLYRSSERRRALLRQLIMLQLCGLNIQETRTSLSRSLKSARTLT